MEIIKICPSESELSEVHTEIRCTEAGCTSVFPNSSNLQMHLIKTHNKESNFLDKKNSNCTYRYFCPVKSCKYAMDPERTENQLRWFTKNKYVKQHYLRVHKEKEFECPSCAKNFRSEKERENHVNTECGKQFSCLSCSFMYNTQSALDKHCKRKNHLSILPSNKKHQPISKAGSLLNNNRLIRAPECPILPKPPAPNNPIEGIAAAALSELSWKIVVRGVDKEVQTVPRKRTPIRSIKKKDSQETQTGEEKAKVSKETQTMCLYKNRSPSNELGTQTQAFHDLFPDLSNSSQIPLDDVILPQFYTSSTQTGEQSFFDIKKDLGLDIFEDKQSSRGYNDQIERLLFQGSMLESRSCNMETQTEMDLPDSLIEPMLSHTETQTMQNTIDEYSHNYTQTCDNIFLNDFVEFSDIETQTAWANLDVDTSVASAETQTYI